MREAIASARERGAEMTIVTGRMFAAAKPFADMLGITGPGRVLPGRGDFRGRDRRGAARNARASRRDARGARRGRDAHGVHAQCYADDTLYVQQINRFSKRYTDLAKVEPIVVPSLREAFADRPSIKIVLVDDAGSLGRTSGGAHAVAR